MRGHEPQRFIRNFEDLTMGDVAIAGGKNASLGEMVRNLRQAGIRVPGGFATTSDAFWLHLDEGGLRDRIGEAIDAMRADRRTLSDTGWRIRQMILDADMPAVLQDEIAVAYEELAAETGNPTPSVAVRSSATAEDLPDASFAGQQETYLNICGIEPLLAAIRSCFASLFTDRAISYREQKGFEHSEVALSVGVQRMVRSDLSGSGVMFSLDTESGFPKAILINAAWGLGETVVQGAVDPDEYVVFKPFLDDPAFMPILTRSIGSKMRKMIYARGGQKTVKTVHTTAAERNGRVLTDGEVLELARWAVEIERHYGKPMDMEWAKDGKTGELYIVQARPETVQSRKSADSIVTYRVKNPPAPVVSGAAIGDSVASGSVCRIEHHDEMSRFRPGEVLVAPMTDPDWVPLMKQAAAIVTDQGGRTCHAAIVSRELGIPAVIGTGDATHHFGNGDVVTVDCSSGDRGHVYAGEVPYTTEELDLSGIGETRTKVMLNVGTPGAAFSFWRLPADGIGLARMEFIISNHVRVHPMALLHPERVSSVKDSAEIERLTYEYEDKPRYFVDKLSEGIARIAASRHPQPVIVRMSDFKTNEYADLIGGAAFEPTESNPMIGFRGASRYYDEAYREGFGLECAAIRRVREEIGLDNVVVMIPFCRTLEEADKVLRVMSENGLERGKNGLKVFVMAEIPSNVILAADFAKRFDGFSIGSNDLTQLLLGVDRDSERLAAVFDERNEAVTRMIRSLIETAHANGTTVGFCGQAPSDHPGYAEFLVQAGIDSISVTPDVLVDVKRRVMIEEGGA